MREKRISRKASGWFRHIATESRGRRMMGTANNCSGIGIALGAGFGPDSWAHRPEEDPA